MNLPNATKWTGFNFDWVKRAIRSVPNSSDELIFVKRRALDGPFFDKNTGFRRAHRRAKFMFLIFFFLSKFAKKVKIEQN